MGYFDSTDGFSVNDSVVVDGNRNISAVGATFTGTISIGGGPGLTSIVSNVNGVTGGVTIAQGSNVTVTTSGSTITIASSGGGGSVPLASASVTGVASFGDEFVVSALGAVSLTSNYVKTVNGLTGALTITGNAASNMNVTVSGTNIFVALSVLSGTADPSGGTDGNIYLQYTV